MTALFTPLRLGTLELTNRGRWPSSNGIADGANVRQPSTEVPWKGGVQIPPDHPNGAGRPRPRRPYAGT
jgi:hypothetical protein